MRIYELTYDHQMEGHTLGFFTSVDSALEFLKKRLNDNTIKVTRSFPEQGFYYLSNTDYSITAKGVIQ